MLLVSFLDLLVESLDLTSYTNVTLAFATGAWVIMLINLFLPHMELGKREDGALSSDRPRVVFVTVEERERTCMSIPSFAKWVY